MKKINYTKQAPALKIIIKTKLYKKMSNNNNNRKKNHSCRY